MRRDILTQERAARDAARMLTSWARVLLQIWHDGRAPIVAAMVATALLLAGRVLRRPLLQAVAAGAALCAGWIVAAGVPSLLPRLPAERLPVLALAALAAGVAAELRGRGFLAGFVLAVAGAWWLAGAPRTEAAAAVVLPLKACMAL